MIIRKATGSDANDLKTLYCEFLTHYPPKEEQNMQKWQDMLNKFEKDDNMHLLVAVEDGKAVSSVQMAIIESLTHNVRPFAIIENVVTLAEYRNNGFIPHKSGTLRKVTLLLRLVS